ncbi:rhodanese-like domain-containing protein [Nonlabens sp. YIK11]|uniref:rhodanese-like domain-containing protein n=1 Tax=Nonlabens sp. YIK11 TaxID=1453349 RepID=UPI001E3DD724|nr:rhodanese-like domain-containing protein [Nonlabens sp. YIK11]
MKPHSTFKMTIKKHMLVAVMFFMGVAVGEAQSIDDVLKKYNTQSVPYISVQELKMNYQDYIILDTRKLEEFEVSHLPNAIWAGESLKDWKGLAKTANKNKPIVVYCTVGVRSENYGEKLQEAGFSDVKNLYGSIFAWKDAGYEVVDQQGKPTEDVHTYSKAWAKYLKTGNKVTGKN